MELQLSNLDVTNVKRFHLTFFNFSKCSIDGEKNGFSHILSEGIKKHSCANNILSLSSTALITMTSVFYLLSNTKLVYPSFDVTNASFQSSQVSFEWHIQLHIVGVTMKVDATRPGVTAGKLDSLLASSGAVLCECEHCSLKYNHWMSLCPFKISKYYTLYLSLISLHVSNGTTQDNLNKHIVIQILFFPPTGSRGRVQDHPGSLPPVRELSGAAGQQAVLFEQFHRLEHIGLDFRGHPSLLVASQSRNSDKVLSCTALKGFTVRAGRMMVWSERSIDVFWFLGTQQEHWTR